MEWLTMQRWPPEIVGVGIRQWPSIHDGDVAYDDDQSLSWAR